MGAEESKLSSGPSTPSIAPNVAESTSAKAYSDADKARQIVKNDEAIRRKVRAGQQYSMKVVIRGDRATGKSTLWKRLQGKSFSYEVFKITVSIPQKLGLHLYVLLMLST